MAENVFQVDEIATIEPSTDGSFKSPLQTLFRLSEEVQDLEDIFENYPGGFFDCQTLQSLTGRWS